LWDHKSFSRRWVVKTEPKASISFIRLLWDIDANFERRKKGLSLIRTSEVVAAAGSSTLELESGGQDSKNPGEFVHIPA
jgi:hypothetical protein